MNSVNWNPWHGCKKFSEGCKNCYVYRGDSSRGIDASEVRKTRSYTVPVARLKNGEYKIPSGCWFYTCFTSDFLLKESDEWRGEAWHMMRERSDCNFFFVTKRIERFEECMPPDWGTGYENVHICCTAENQRTADIRLPIFKRLPIKHKYITSEPLLGSIDMSAHLGPWVKQVTVGGESGKYARLCRYEWVLDIRRQCIEADVPFYFKQTGAHFEKDGREYRIERRFQHIQAAKAGINTAKALINDENG